MSEKAPVLCPHCSEPLSASIQAKAMAKHRLAVKLHPKEGTRLSAETVGGSLVQLAKMLRSCGKDMDVRTLLLVDSINTNSDGEIVVEFIVANFDPKRGAGDAG